MARPIDAYTLNNDLVSWYNDTEDEKEKSILRRVMQRVVQAPTLTPPNEPLTCEGCYYIKNDDYPPCAWCIRSKVNEDYYRRPPEGEEHCYG